MDSQSKDYKLQTTGQGSWTTVHSLVAVAMIVLFPVAGHTATGSTNTAGKVTEVKTSATAKTTTATAAAASQVKASEAKVVPAGRKLIGKEGTRTVSGKMVVTTDPLATTEDGLPTNEKIRSGDVTGSVLQVRGGKGAQIGIAQEKSDEYFVLDPAVRLENVKKLSEIKRGDIVKARYEERYRADDKNLYKKRVVKEIIFLKKKPPEPVAVAPVAEEEGEA